MEMFGKRLKACFDASVCTGWLLQASHVETYNLLDYMESYGAGVPFIMII